jgi:hypothetical protein
MRGPDRSGMRGPDRSGMRGPDRIEKAERSRQDRES